MKTFLKTTWVMVAQAYGACALWAFQQGQQWIDVGYGLNPLLAGAVVVLAVVVPPLLARVVIR